MDDREVIYHGELNERLEQERLQENAEYCIEEHKKAWEVWQEGNIVETWEDEQGNTCVKYESGNWWHYKEDPNGNVEWW